MGSVIRKLILRFVGNLLDRGTAEAYIRECRHSHVTWAEWAAENSESEHLEVAGDEEHHRRWIRLYDHVLQTLRGSI